MKKSFIIYAILLLGVIFASKFFAQPYIMNGKSGIGLSLGMYSGYKSSGAVAIGGFNTQVDANGFAGSLYYKNWLQENLALRFSIGMLTGSANVSVSSFNATTQASAVMPMLIGMNYYFTDLFSNNSIRPFVSGSIGMYLGSEASNTILSQKVHSESAFGGRAGAGIDFILSNHFILGANLGYNMMSNFSTPIGGNKNYNGGDFVFQVEYIF